MWSKRSIGFCAGMGLAVASCSSVATSPDRVVETEVSAEEQALGAEREQARADLATATELWQSHGTATYVYTLQISCFCDPETNHPVRVAVEEGVVVSAQDTVTLLHRPERAIPIDELLAEAQVSAQSDVGGRTVTYDPTLGYPLDIFAYDPSCADCYSGLSIDCFAPGAGPEACPMPTFSAADCARQQRTPVQASELVDGLCEGETEPLIALTPPGAVCCP